jgi:virginiamycin B lyase
MMESSSSLVTYMRKQLSALWPLIAANEAMRTHMNATNKFTALLAALLIAGCTGQSQPAVAPTASAAPTVAPTAPPLTIKPTTTRPAPTVTTPEPQPTQAAAPTSTTAALALQEYPVPRGSHPHDVAAAPDGAIWYTAQASGQLGRLDPASGATRQIALGDRSAPHGVIVGPDGAPWITDGGMNAIVRVDPATEQVQTFPLPANRAGANLNTAVFDKRGVLWFTGQTGIYGRLDPKIGTVEVFDAPRGGGPYGITATPDGTVYYASLAGSHIARLDPETGQATPIDPPTAGQGARRVWSDSRGRVWVSEWNAGQLGMYDPAANSWREWKLPGERPQAYAVFVDDRDIVWLSDFGANAIVRFDPATEQFESFGLPSSTASVRQIHGRPGEVWGAESGVDKIVVIRHTS